MKTKSRVQSMIWMCYPNTCILAGLCFLGISGAMRSKVQSKPKAEVHFLVAQKSKTSDCGAASLYLIGKLTGLSYSLERTRELTSTTMLGVNMMNLKNAGEKLGFKVDACVCGYSELCEHLCSPKSYAILYSPKGHFIAAIGKATGGRVRIADVGRGVFDLSDEDIANRYKWDGSVLLIQ